MPKGTLSALRGVGPKVLGKLNQAGIESIEDLWFFLPRSYEDRTRLTQFRSLQHGLTVQVQGRVVAADVLFRGRRILRVLVEDDDGNALTLTFFHFTSQQAASFRNGSNIVLFGQARQGFSGFEMVHPTYRLLRAGEVVELSDRLDPVYPAIEGVGAPTLRKMVHEALLQMPRDESLELLPADVVAHLSLPSLRDALLLVHQPPVGTDLNALKDGSHPAQQRLAFEELLAHQLSLRQQRLAHQQRKAHSLRDPALLKNLRTSLPYTLTNAQDRVLTEIARDLATQTPMLRLVQGDVGSGKTIVAALSALLAVANGQQVAVMAPTELLAEQHLNNFKLWLEPLGINVAWLVGKVTGKARTSVLEEIASGYAQVIVGTHALMQSHVAFHDLALVVVDEQHRFGVHQRLALRDKGEQGQFTAHQLVMTATPIPRTLAMTAYADLDVSAIDELPPGRTPVRTLVVNSSKRDQLIERIAMACSEGRQAYWVCTLIEENEEIEAQAAEATHEYLTKHLPKQRVGLIHGRLKPAEKQRIMAAFKNHELDVLVATTVIEVGVDVPNASLMIIENAERLGLAQLHQLRGRVGRGSAVSDCLLLYREPLGQIAKQRLQTMRDTNDGFVIAQKDLELRGPGEILGTRQTGITSFRFADLMRDSHLLPAVQKVAQDLMAKDAGTVEKLLKRWIGHALRYVEV